MALRKSLLPAAAALALLALPATASATAPWACLDLPDGFMTPVVGVPHDISATCSFDGDGHDLVLYEWDLDGDGTYETSTGGDSEVTHTWTDRAATLDATIDVGVRVTDAAGESGEWSEPLRLTDEINSWFTFDVPLVNPGDEVALAAYIRPYEVDGRTWTYEWDLDGDGTYEHSSGMLPDAIFVAPEAIGPRAVGLKVTNDLGAESVVRREIEVLPRHPSRDQIVYDAPTNMLDAPVPSDTPPPAPAPLVPAGTTELAPLPDQPRKVRRPKLKRIDADKYGMRLHYVRGPKWSRYRVTVSIPAKLAASYGLPRRRVVFARGTLVFNARGVGRTAKMRWTKGAYDVFRRVRQSTLYIRGKRIA
ncbi:MAG TPA: hypothetical protein VF587_19815 [Solirubrobacteraceae bacterium]|jgi:hypothetical protein